MNDRDCESCKKFSRIDPIESEGYCEAKRTWVDPQEGEDCKMHEFTLHSATKYKDGTPIMSEPKKIAEQSNQLDTNYCKLGTCPHYDKFCDHTLQDKHMCPYLPHDTDSSLKYLEQVFTEFAKTQDELIEEYDSTLKTHGETLEDHHERITINEGNIDSLCSDVEDLQRKVYQIYYFLNSVDPDFFAKTQDEFIEEYDATLKTHSETLEEHLDRICDLENMYESILDDLCAMRERLCKITDLLVEQDKYAHIFSNFCGNCTHVNKCQEEDGIYTCELSGEIVDPDDSSCSMFEPPF